MESGHTSSGPGAHLAIQQQHPHSPAALLALYTRGQIGPQQQRLARARVRLDKHRADGDVADDTAEAM
jgi:hypothetical protein